MDTGPNGVGQPPDISSHLDQNTASTPVAGENGRMRSSSNASATRESGHVRQSSGGSTMSRPQATQHATGMPRPPPASSTISRTHVGGIQPSPGFFKPHKPSNVVPPRVNQTHRNSGEVLELGPLAPRKSQDSTSSFALSNQASTHPLTTTSAPKDAKPRRPTQSSGRSLLAPLLPIGGRARRPTVSSTGVSSISPKSEFRASLDKLFRRTSSDGKGPSPISREPSKTKFGHRPPSPIDLEIGPVAAPVSHSSAPTSPNSPATPVVSTMHHPPNPLKGFDSHTRPLSAAYTYDTNPHTDNSHTFIPHPILADPNGLFPRMTIPLNPKSTGKKQKVKRNYHGYPSKNIFFFGGRIITGGGDSPLPFIATSILVLGLTGVWFGTTAVFWWHHSAGGIAITIIGVYLSLLTITNMFVTAFRDPGILPRNLDPDPPYPSWSHTSANDPEAQPLPRDILVRQNMLRVKYCTTCRTYRPPRATHCRLCDNCVDGCDHHCQWLNTCVGRRNYTSFIAVLVFGTLTLIYVIITAAFHIFLIHSSFREDLRQSIGSAVVFVLGILILLPVVALFSYHIRLLLHNMTTVERLRTKAQIKLTKEQSQSNTSLPRNPFQMRWYNNIGYLLCRPGGFDWIEAGEPQYLDGRLINPGAICEYQPPAQHARWSGHEHDLERGHHHHDMGELDEDERVDPGYAREAELMQANGGDEHPAFHIKQEKEDGHADELDEVRNSVAISGEEEVVEQTGGSEKESTVEAEHGEETDVEREIQ